MKLIIDYGNTLVKIALFQQDSIVSIKSGKSVAVDQCLELLKETKNMSDSSLISNNAIVSSVINYPDDIKTWLNQEYHLLELNTHTPLPIQINYKTPETLGKDRIALAVAGSQLYPGKNLLIIDAGTCITYDFINKDKEYLGGSISPGIQMRFTALNTFTDKLPLINPADNVELIGSSTSTSISSGVMCGVYAEIDGIIDRYRLSFPDIEIILTGGDIIYFDKKLKNNIFANSNLVLKGLNMILDYNVEKQTF
jgi:type III pantothenate kinase